MSTTRSVTLSGVVLLVMLLLAGGATRPLSAQSTDHIVGPHDVLAVSVLNEPTLSGKFTVVADGTVTYPLVGAVKVGGLSLHGVETELTKKLADGFLEKPVVSVTLDQNGSQQVLVVGEVRQAGSYPLMGRMTVLEALLKAGAPTQNAGTEALIVRGGALPAAGGSASGTNGQMATNGQPTVPPGSRVVHVNLDALQRGDLSQNLVLLAGDMVFVPRAEPAAPVYVTGQVKAPGAFQPAKGATVLQLLAQAGGVTDRGSTGRITIVRKVPGKSTPVELKAALHDPVQPGDTIIVGRRLF